MITLKKAFRKDENTVCVMYRLNKLHYDFVVYWGNIDESTGELSRCGYSLELDCLSRSESFNERVTNAIREGESDNNSDAELYLAIRDTFDSLDCEEVE